MNKKPIWPIFDSSESRLLQKSLKRSIGSASAGKNVGYTTLLEKEFSKFHKKKYAVACANCTVGLEAILLCANIGPGDEVLVPAYTYTSSVTSIIRVGAIPKFVDVEQRTLCTNLDLIKQAVTKKTKAIMLVHFGGYLSDLKSIKKYIRNKKIRVIEDAAQCHGSKRNGYYAGEVDAGAIFSFQRNKNMCSGEGGMLLTNNKRIAKKFREIIWHGTKPGNSSVHNFVGSNFRITEFQSAILLAQLKKLKKFNEERMKVCSKLDEGLKQIKEIEVNYQNEMQVHARHLYTLRVKSNISQQTRRAIIKKLNKNNIICGPGYKYPVYKSPIFTNRKFPNYFIESNKKEYKKWLNYIDKLNLENSEKVCKKNINFVHFNFINNKNIDKIIIKIIKNEIQ